MPQATVHLLRHGEVYNPDGVLYGQAARVPPLRARPGDGPDACGALQCERSAQGAKIVHLVASPLTRAQETAQPISEALNLQITTEARIIEAANYFEGLHVDKAEILRPKHWPMLRNPFRPSWGEAYKDQAARVMAAVQDARLRAIELGGEGAEAILVSHQLPIWATRLSAEGKPLWHDPRKRECTLTSVTSLMFDDAGNLLRVEYSEPAAALLPGASSTPGA